MAVLSTLELVGLFAIIFAFGFYVNRIDQRVMAVRNQVARLSLTFLKIENDLTAIQDSLIVLARGGDQAIVDILKIRDRQPARYKQIIENGPEVAEVMRGLELPDIDDDPNFWSADRMKKFGFGATENQEDGE